MYEAILWDMDGTLVDSEPLWGIATYEMSEAIGRRLTPAIRELTVGGTFANTIRICEEFAGVVLTPQQREMHRQQMYRRVSELFATDLTLVPGVAELLDALVAHKVPMMVVTNTPRELADPAIDAIGRQRFVDTLCGDEVTRGKPDPEIYATAASRLGVAPAKCLVFEDSATGMAAAASAGCRVVGLPASEEIVVPPEVLPLAQLHGSSSFLGVTPVDLMQWYAKINAHIVEIMQQ
ncbi:HAD family hydrolase [Corynebacterium epidermidicanis]|uniref:Haloacid dehalogenase superfamily enzyme, subfamily IA n=1 Tax=Corynebacterium epidermidicanis TaxID=1050174 RepID=A0A0G3GRH1_9CORY|nr:HAD family phosphatase [Corynebacterium epidermidicanis]AKK03155.1 haloacid dehalogenase superfamily enzyme, subfamily IA [Corynebacterium epidermidicanis]